MEEKTISSFDLVYYINCFSKKEIYHNLLVKKIHQIFQQELLDNKMRSSFTFLEGKEYPIFILTLDHSKKLLNEYGNFIKISVIQHLERLGKQYEKNCEYYLKHSLNTKSKTITNFIRTEQIFQVKLAISNRVDFLSKERKNYLYKNNLDWTKEEINKYNYIFEIHDFADIYRDIKINFGNTNFEDIALDDYDNILDFVKSWVFE